MYLFVLLLNNNNNNNNVRIYFNMSIYQEAVYVHDDVGANLTERLSFKTICMQSVHGDQLRYKHYDVHNIYGHYQALVTYQYV